MSIEENFHQQTFPNGYQFVNGVVMHEENGDRFQIPPLVLKNYLSLGHFVEVRVDSPRFSVHPDAPEQCTCSTCNGEASKPVLTHEQPLTLAEVPIADIPSRGWGEDFWVQVTDRDGDYLIGRVDNNLYESRLHDIQFGETVAFHVDHVLTIHPTHRQELVMSMTETDLRLLIDWLNTQ